MNDIYCIGEMLIDFTPGEQPASFIRNAGGAPANVAITAVRNGLTASLCCKVGDDDFGRFLMDTLKENNVRAASPDLCAEAITTLSFVSLKEDGDRSFIFVRKPGADMFLAESDVKEEDIADSVIIHGGSCSLSAEPAASATRRALSLGHKMGKLVSFDVNYRNIMWQDRKDDCAAAVMDILKDVDILKISDEELDMMGGREDLPDLMENKGIKAVIVTMGAMGAECCFEGQTLKIAGEKVKAVDTTAAGDAFWGGFISSLRHQGITIASELTAEVIQSAMDYGTVCGALSVQKKGAIAAIPSREEVLRYMENR